jgi:ACR3 family arsenite efflux pump ArsB
MAANREIHLAHFEKPAAQSRRNILTAISIAISIFGLESHRDMMAVERGPFGQVVRCVIFRRTIRPLI